MKTVRIKLSVPKYNTARLRDTQAYSHSRYYDKGNSRTAKRRKMKRDKMYL